MICALCVGTGQDRDATCPRCKGATSEPIFNPGLPAPQPAPERTS